MVQAYDRSKIHEEEIYNRSLSLIRLPFYDHISQILPPTILSKCLLLVSLSLIYQLSHIYHIWLAFHLVNHNAVGDSCLCSSISPFDVRTFISPLCCRTDMFHGSLPRNYGTFLIKSTACQRNHYQQVWDNLPCFKSSHP